MTKFIPLFRNRIVGNSTVGKNPFDTGGGGDLSTALLLHFVLRATLTTPSLAISWHEIHGLFQWLNNFQNPNRPYHQQSNVQQNRDRKRRAAHSTPNAYLFWRGKRIGRLRNFWAIRTVNHEQFVNGGIGMSKCRRTPEHS
ncbi:MAG: hypothetical protein ACO3F7_06870 [Luteolibacter sp.]